MLCLYLKFFRSFSGKKYSTFAVSAESLWPSLVLSWDQLLPPTTCAQPIKVLPTLPLALVNFSSYHQALSPEATSQRSSLSPAWGATAWANLFPYLFNPHIFLQLPLQLSLPPLGMPFWLLYLLISHTQTRCHTFKKHSHHQAKLCFYHYTHPMTFWSVC